MWEHRLKLTIPSYTRAITKWGRYKTKTGFMSAARKVPDNKESCGQGRTRIDVKRSGNKDTASCTALEKEGRLCISYQIWRSKTAQQDSSQHT
jgi:hypothetical protein